MPLQTPPTLSAEAFAVLAGSFLSGAMLNVSILTIPVLLDTATNPTHLLNQWLRTYHYGHRILPALAIATCCLYGYAAYNNHAAGTPWRVFALAGVSTVGIMPFTWTVMAGTNDRLFRARAKGVEGKLEGGMEEVRGVVRRWNRLHVVRSLFPLVGAVVGLLGTWRVVVF